MRTVRMSSEPFAPRQRVLRFTGALVALIALAAVSPARAAVVGITLDVTAIEPFWSVPIASCPVSVDEGSDGVEVLAAAQDAGCIDSYETSDSQFGRFLECINGVCGTEATYWRMALDGEATPYGVDGYRAANGDALTFSYTTWVGCLVDPALC